MAKKYTEEHLEELVVQLEAMCKKGILPTHRCPVGSEEYKLAIMMNNHRDKFSQEQKDRIEAAKELAKEKTKRPRRPPYTAEQIEDIVVRMEEMCSKGILPTIKCPKGSEELKLAYLVMSHNHQFSPKQKKRIEAAKKLAKNIIRSSNKNKRYNQYDSEQLEDLVLQMEEYSRHGIYPTTHFPKGSDELVLANKIRTHMYQFSKEQLERLENTKPNVIRLKENFKQYEEMFLNGRCPLQKYPKESPEYQVYAFLSVRSKRLSQNQKDYMSYTRKLSKIESDVVYESSEDRLKQYQNNVIHFCIKRNRFPFMNRKTEEQLYCQMQILLLGSYRSQAASSFRKYHENMTEQFLQADKRHNSERRLKTTNVNVSETIQNTPYVEAVKKYETKMDRLTEENREMVERILSDNMTRIRFEARCNALESVQTETKFLDLMEIFDFWTYHAAYKIFMKKFGKELA